MMISECGACGQDTGWAFGAQFMNVVDGERQHIIICVGCWDAGQRCWLCDDGDLVVSTSQPAGSKEATLYWDEGDMTTGVRGRDPLPRTYPSEKQP